MKEVTNYNVAGFKPKLSLWKQYGHTVLVALFGIPLIWFTWFKIIL